VLRVDLEAAATDLRAGFLAFPVVPVALEL
jgi:hypothetical protein